MSRKGNFLVGLAAAALTFGSLYGTLGSARFNKSCQPCHTMQHCCMPEMESCKSSEIPASQCTRDSVAE